MPLYANSPSEFSMILGTFPSITATAEFVVPKKDISRQWFGHFVSSPTQINTDHGALHLFFSDISVRSYE
jgi:hypothetical protein